MASYQVTCVTKKDRLSKHEHITHVGLNSQYYVTREQAIHYIEVEKHHLYTRDVYGNVATVGVVREAGKAPYLRTYADKKWTDNLLALPECK